MDHGYDLRRSSMPQASEVSAAVTITVIGCSRYGATSRRQDLGIRVGPAEHHQLGPCAVFCGAGTGTYENQAAGVVVGQAAVSSSTTVGM